MKDRNGPITGSSAAVYPSATTRFIIFVVVGTIFILVMALFIMMDLSEPRLPELRVDSFSISNLAFTNGSRVSSVAEIRLTARNPSIKVSLSYDHVVAGIYYKFMLLSQASLAPFSQRGKNKTSLVAKFAADGSFVEKWVVDGINGDIGQHGRVELDFSLHSWVNWESKWWWSSGRDVLKVFCRNLTVAIPSNGNPGRLIGRPGHCLAGKGDDHDLYFI